MESDNYTRHIRSLHQLSSSDPCPMCLLHGESRTFSRHDGLQAHYLRVHGLHLGSPSDPLSINYEGTIYSAARQLPSRSRGLFANSTLKPPSRSRGFKYFGPRTNPVYNGNDSDEDCEDRDRDLDFASAAGLAATDRSKARMTWNALSADTPMASMLEHGTAPSRVGKGDDESSQGASKGYGRSGSVHGAPETGQTLLSQHQAQQPPRRSTLSDLSSIAHCAATLFSVEGLTNHVRRMHRD